MTRFCLALCLLLPSIADAQAPIKAGIAPGSYVVGTDVLTIASDGTRTWSAVTIAIGVMNVSPVPPGPGPTPGPNPVPVPVLNARAQAVLDAVKGIADQDKARNAAGFAAVLKQTKDMLVANNVGDATVIGMTLQFAMSKTVAAIPAGAAWKPVTDVIGAQFNEQQKTNSGAVLAVIDDAVAGLSAASPSGILELQFVVDPKTAKAAIGADGKEIANPRYSSSMAAAPGAFDWMALITQLLPLILAILQMFMSSLPTALLFIASLV